MEHQISPMTSPSPSASAAAAATTTNPSDPLHTWWTSISKARSRIQILSTLLPSLDPTIADSDNPSLSLLSSFSAYSAFSSSLSSNPHPLCHWLYDTFLLPDLQLLTLNFIPTLTSLYFSNLTHHHSNSNSNNSISAFEAVLLAIYSSETKSRNGKPITVSLPDLSLPSLYHNPNPAGAHPSTFKSYAPRTAVVSPPLEAQAAVKSTKRGVIVGVVFECYFKRISEMPSWSKLDFCKFVVGWAGQDCECKSEFDETDSFDEEVVVEKDDVVGKRRIPLPWELLQPMLKILGHCLLGPLNGSEVKDGAAEAVRCLYARACHDLVPQAILATRSLIQLDNRGRKDAVLAAANVVSSNSNTPSKAAKKPEILLVSK